MLPLFPELLLPVFPEFPVPVLPVDPVLPDEALGLYVEDGFQTRFAAQLPPLSGSIVPVALPISLVVPLP